MDEPPTAVPDLLVGWDDALCCESRETHSRTPVHEEYIDTRRT